MSKAQTPVDKLIKSVEGNIQKLSDTMPKLEEGAQEQAIAIRNLTLSLLFLNLSQAFPQLIEGSRGKTS